MSFKETDSIVVFEGKTEFGEYQIIDTVYVGRPARVFFSKGHHAAQSGVALDSDPDLLFDYNQRFLEIAGYTYPERVLVIGGGMFTFPGALLAMLPDVQIDVVEIDKDLPKIARKYFGLKRDSRLNIFHCDGIRYLQDTKSKYDLIIIDAFQDTDVPSQFLTKETAFTIRDHMTFRGITAMNIIATYRGHRSSELRQVYTAYTEAFGSVEIFPAGLAMSEWLPQNYVVTGGMQRKKTLHGAVRYAPLVPPFNLPEGFNE